MTHIRERYVNCIYLDLKKGFDKILHKRLICKLENVGLNFAEMDGRLSEQQR